MRTFYTLGTVFKTLKSHLNVFNSNLKLSGLCKWELINQHIQLHCKQLILLLLTHFLENCGKKIDNKEEGHRYFNSGNIKYSNTVSQTYSILFAAYVSIYCLGSHQLSSSTSVSSGQLSIFSSCSTLLFPLEAMFVILTAQFEFSLQLNVAGW